MVPCYALLSYFVTGVFLFGGVMSNRKSYFENFSTSTLWIVLEQNFRELTTLELKYATTPNKLLKDRIKQIKLVLEVSKNVVVNRYLQDNISLMKIANLLLNSEGIKKKVYQELFTLKVLEKEELISLELLSKVIQELDISELMMIIRNKEDSIYGSLALRRYDELIFDVEPDVYQELIMKKIKDRRR